MTQIRIDEELLLLNNYKITPNEYYLIRTILLYEDFPKYLEEFVVVCKKTNIEIRDMLESLQDKGIITKVYKIPQKGEPFNPYEVTFNQNFIKNCYKASFEMGRELFEVYPQFANINGVTVPLRSVSKKFDSMEDFFRFYAKSIRYNPEVHNNIIELTKWAAENTNIINTTLVNYVVDQRWNDIEAIKNGESSNINLNTVRVL